MLLPLPPLPPSLPPLPSSATTSRYKPPVLVADVPRIFVIDNFASEEELAEIVRQSEPKLTIASTMDPNGKTQPMSKRARDAASYTLQPEEWTPGIARLVDRMDVASLSPGFGQHLSVSSYVPGGHLGIRTPCLRRHGADCVRRECAEHRGCVVGGGCGRFRMLHPAARVGCDGC